MNMKKICPTCKREYGRVENYCTRCGIELVEEQNVKTAEAFVEIKITNYDEMQKKLETLIELQEKAKLLADNLAKMSLDVTLEYMGQSQK